MPDLGHLAGSEMYIVGVRFRLHGKVYDFDAGQLDIKPGEWVVVDTVRGQELGEAVVVRDGEGETSLKSVLRMATAGDIQKSAGLKDKERLVLAECAEIISRLELPMKLVSAEYSLDEAHLTVYFGAEGRVDFRELVRELGHKFHVRVELRQIGPRDEAKILGGYGRCGREFCCARFLSDFNPVSIKMAKTQDLPLNPMKISGVCGRLLCCLGYECEQYREIKEKMPREGTSVMTDAGAGIIVGHNALGEKVLVEYETGARLEIPLVRVRVLDSPRARRTSASQRGPEPASTPQNPVPPLSVQVANASAEVPETEIGAP
ncbi:MAG: stage 0 sporulation family protein [Dehalococcoidia bacterium]|nr:stage 0 sporulation family protein [Dehalococcoidia bacterium]